MFSFPSTRTLRPSESGDGDGATARWRGPSLFPASSPPTRFFIFRPRWMAKKTYSFFSNKPRRSSNNDRPWVSSFLSSLFGFLVLRVSQCSWYNFPFLFLFSTLLLFVSGEADGFRRRLAQFKRITSHSSVGKFLFLQFLSFSTNLEERPIRV